MKKILVSVFFQFGLLTTLISIAGCTKEKTTNMTVPITLPDIPGSDSAYKYLALGDSYTIGQNVQEKERFPFFISELLKHQKIPVNNPRYIAQTGWSTIALQKAIEALEPLGSFDFVTLLIGVNDQYQHLDTAGYRSRFATLLNKAVQLAGGKKTGVFVLSIPDYSATPYVSSHKAQVSKEIDYFNAINKEITLQQEISYTDITSSTREASSDLSLLANDGLHYSAKEHKRWAEKLVPIIKDVLK